MDSKYADVEARKRSNSLAPPLAEVEYLLPLTAGIGSGNGSVPVNEYLLDRWSQELANRRQYLGFLRTLQVLYRIVIYRIF